MLDEMCFPQWKISCRHDANWLHDVSLLDNSLIDPNLVHGPKQVTDIYLLALAVKHNGRLVALDRAIPLNGVLGAEPRHLVLL